MRDRPRHGDKPPEPGRPDHGAQRDRPLAQGELLRLARGSQQGELRRREETVAAIEKANADQHRSRDVPQQGDPLPNSERVDIPAAKFAQYSMNADHPKNRGKAAGWEALGYDVSTPESRERSGRDAIAQLRERLPAAAIRKVETDPEDRWHRATTGVDFTGPNGRNATVVMGWQRDAGRDHYRLLTAWAEVHKEGRDR